ncbi:hypothetical protein BBO99_00001428 [Phytophthora kernoviae]|uniref:Uncharacterized protein n=2 Tax=Phytophthora kernoviae TaxID=325452 RepID=A0A421H0L3_9STRA|nr:hypothetical protein G195_002154 [Phytophthora kernoviae 00238/432]KAG2530560.1 hypothetical protein JM16_000916 [Phytophthora kernoviae]RLN26163.1 hypothetical protein BBI17_001297 [Phytophthora kernoviae]RLN84301.1 hypothetical protein BBO99_00001428 [Phytophthora kernoviae]
MPTFTCEVCKISVRSAQKLMDHVNFSPLHQASLGLGKNSGSNAAKPTQMRRLLYDGSKLFWRVNETLDLCIYEDKAVNCVTIRAFPHSPPQSLDSTQVKSSADSIPPLEIDLRLLRQILGLESASKTPTMYGRMAASTSNLPKTKLTGDPATPDNSGELLSKYLLARLHARRDAHDRVNLVLQKVHDNEIDPMELLLATTSGAQALPTDLAIRRRHTIDDVKDAQKEVSVATTRLKNARVKAEELSNLARMTLDTFSQTYGSYNSVEPRMMTREQAKVAALASSASNTMLGLNGGRRYSVATDKPTATWMRAYDRAVLHNGVERSKDVLEQLPQFHDQATMRPIDESN